MNIKTISVTYGRKLNLGNYQSAEINFSAWADIVDEENPAACAHTLRDFCRDQVKKEAMRLLNNGKAVSSRTEH